MKDPLIIQLSEELNIDLNNLSSKDWQRIQNDAKFLMQAKHTNNVGKAYIAAFWLYMQDLSLLADPFNPDLDKFN